MENMRREHARERAETRDDETYTREGEEFTIQMIREKMARLLDDAEISREARKEKLAAMKEEIELILDARDEREYQFIERELEHHRLEQELALEIEREERESRVADGTEPDEKNVLPLVRPLITASAEQMRKEIEEKRRRLNEDEQCSTILLSTSERGEIPGFAPPRRRKKRDEKEQSARLDTLVLKQREISLMYHESQELQHSMLGKEKKKSPEPEEIENPEENEDSGKNETTP